MKHIIEFLSLILALVLCTANVSGIDKDSLYEQKVLHLLELKPNNFDSLYNSLKSYRRDTSKMRKAYEDFLAQDYLEGASYACSYLASSYQYYSEYEISKNLHETSLELAQKCNNELMQAIALNKLGVIYRRTNRMQQSIDKHQLARAIAASIENPTRRVNLNLATSENSIGNCYTILNQHEQSIPYFERALEIESGLNNKLGMAINNQNIGHANELLGDPDIAMEYYENSLALNESINNRLGKIICKNSIARILLQRGVYQKAADMIAPLIPDVKEIKDVFHTSLVLVNYGDAQIKLGQYAEARKALEEALSLSLENDLSFSIVESYEHLSTLESKLGNFEQALTYKSKAKESNDKIVNEQNNQYINDLVYKYDAEKNEHKIDQLSLENEKVKTRLRVNQIISASIAFGALCFGGMLFSFFNQRQKRKDQEIITLKKEHQIKTLESLIKGEEKERNRIAKELHDGLNGDLSAIKFKLSKITEDSDLDVSEVVTMIDESCQQVRTISHNLIPPSLENFNLVEAAEEFCSNMDSSNKENIHFQYVGNNISIDKKSEVNIFRIIQELVTNSIKHADATEIDIQISQQGELLQITVEDNGHGFDPKNVTDPGIGLQNIKSRINYLGAELDFSSNERGTSYLIEIDTLKVA